MLELRPLKEGDIDLIKDDCIEESVKKYGDLITPSDYCHSVWLDGICVGVGGVVEYWKGVGEVWVLLSKKVLQVPVQMVRCIRKIYEKYSQDRKFTRLQCIVSSEFKQGQKLVESLGFQKEGLLRKYLIDGIDAYIYSIVR